MNLRTWLHHLLGTGPVPQREEPVRYVHIDPLQGIELVRLVRNCVAEDIRQLEAAIRLAALDLDDTRPFRISRIEDPAGRLLDIEELNRIYGTEGKR